MTPAENIDKLFKNSNATVGQKVDEKILNDALGALPDKQSGANKNIWRLIMHSKITKIAVAAGVILMVYWLTLSDNGISRTYAIDQTLEAMNTIKSVHFKAELYKQGDIECWMLFDEPACKPTHVCLYRPGFPIRKIDSPEGSFGYNEITNRYRLNRRDERKCNWYPDFSNFFKQSLERGQKDDTVIITNEYNDELAQDVIVISIDEGDRKCRYIIDPETKLPIRFITLETSNFMKYFRQTIAVRNISFIEYNKPAPEGLFTVRDDAELVTNEHDIHVHPDTGMAVGSLTHEQACEKIIRDVTEAMNQRDWKTVQQLLFPFGPPPKEMLAKLPKDTSQPLVEILEIGRPYEEGSYWYIPVKSREVGGKIKDEKVPIKFYEFNGKRFCKIMWPD